MMRPKKGGDIDYFPTLHFQLENSAVGGQGQEQGGLK